MELHLKICGWLLVILALIHIIFPRYFKWKSELSSLSIMNRQMMKVHSFFIALTVFLMGILCLTSSTELIRTVLGNRIILGLAVFWNIRFFIQLFGYSTQLWKGKFFETMVHIAFTMFWIYLSIVFLMIFFASKFNRL